MPAVHTSIIKVLKKCAAMRQRGHMSLLSFQQHIMVRRLNQVGKEPRGKILLCRHFNLGNAGMTKTDVEQSAKNPNLKRV